VSKETHSVKRGIIHADISLFSLFSLMHVLTKAQEKLLLLLLLLLLPLLLSSL